MYTVSSSSSTKNLLLLSSTPSSATTTPKLIPTIKIPFLSKPMFSISNSNSNSNHHLKRNLIVLVVYSKPSSSSEGAESLSSIDEWLERLPEKDMPLYSHSLPCIEAWLRKLGFHQSKEDRSVWFVEKVDWHAQLSLDVTDLNIRYSLYFHAFSIGFSSVFDIRRKFENPNRYSSGRGAVHFDEFIPRVGDADSEFDSHLKLLADVFIRLNGSSCMYLKRGPGDLGKDVERRFSYALSREDIENAILGGP
ncbi:hypothetical protein ACFE04_009538 [Oxalis oulophora]